MQGHKHSLGRAYHKEFWNETIVIFKHPRYDFNAGPRVSFVGEAGVDCGGLGREYGMLLRNAIFSAEATRFEGLGERKLPLYSIDGLYSKLFELAGKMVSFLIIHLDIGIPCLRTASLTPECCLVDDVVDMEL